MDMNELLRLQYFQLRTDLVAHAAREFANEEFEWLMHRQIYLKQIDVVQLEYTPLAQYRCVLGVRPPPETPSHAT